ncbi:hypothetical protein FOVG_10655 [Fusarium oxysporum f. sp. pisi HDV247]|uniref:Uncharacterized protein n=1 Tax=Fusarium oxysporum f. sp. pisi HDV247 TaxID=1080344 RepID=W9P1G4_FUSOX|nr:hypothetical protein FOVG_10655 [Fusarium oxysporum f. sp. pisi HDV247]
MLKFLQTWTDVPFLLWRNWLRVFHRLHNIRRSIRHCKVRRRNLPIWHRPPRHDDAKHLVCHHGPDPVHLRSRSKRHHVKQHQGEDGYPHGVSAARCWHFGRAVRHGCWLCYWHRWRCRSSCKFAATTSLYRNGPHPHLCRGSRLIRCHCVHPYVNSFHRWCNRMQVLRRTNQSAVAWYHVRP